jgi:hypothetical protein
MDVLCDVTFLLGILFLVLSSVERRISHLASLTRHFKKYGEVYVILVLAVAAIFLRFTNLGYSDYISDEPGTFLYRGTPERYAVSPLKFLLQQKKGPIQVFVGMLPYSIVGNYNNELAQRIPFALYSVLAIIIFYKAISKLTKNRLAGFLAAALLMVNGFIVAFGRVAQYQNLNMFFSFAALYFYSELLISSKKLIKNTLLGTLMFSISLLSHWDAVYILPVVIFIFVKFLLNPAFSKKYKVRILLYNFLLGCLLLLPFLSPYVAEYLGSLQNQEYFSRRVGLRDTFDMESASSRFLLYNPFFTYQFYVVCGLLGILFDLGAFTLWFGFCFIVYKFFIHHSGTHIYNLVIPAIVLSAVGISGIVRLLPRFVKILPVLVALGFIGFFYYQSWLLFVDHTKEYPWEQEIIWKYETREYTHEDVLTNKIGFPLKRNWREISDFVNEQNKLNGEDFGYITNEDKGLAGFYMDVPYRDHSGFYAIGIKRPLSFANDYKFPQIRGKHTIKKFEISGENMVQIYRVEEL